MCKTMEKLLFFGLLVLVHQTASEDVIYKLSKAEHSRMPPKNHLDRFDHCVNQPQGAYCTAHADVVADGPSELLDMMRAYSAHTTKHLNYTKLTYGLCLTQNCRSFYNGSHDEAALRTAAEACLNHSLSAEYNLKTRVTKVNCYFEDKSKFDTDWIDWLVAFLLFGILALNLIGTVYDVNRDQTKPENVYLMSFSLRVNWKQMVAPPSSDPKMVLLRPINGVRVITSILVILGHVPLPLMVANENPTWIENAYDVTAYHILAQGHLITLSFFLISGFLLAYNIQIHAEKSKLTWKVLPMAIINRFLRLTPINIVSLLLAATWMRFTSYGPLWQEIIGEEVQDCRNYWLYNLFYVNNLVDHSQCVLQTWYLACDMQLHIIGLFVILIAPSAKARWWMLGALYAIGFAWPAYHIYTKDLDATLLASPTTMSEFFITDPTFNWVYKRTYGNMPMFIIGIVFGYLVYDWQQRNVFSKDLTKYRFIYWMLFPVLIVVTSSAGLLYCADAPRASIAARLAFAPIVKPLFVSIVMLIILGAMFKIENFKRSIMEWGGWVPLSRISYCVYAFHVCVLRLLGGTRTVLAHFSLLHLMQDYAGVTIITFKMALIFYLCVEAPFTHLAKIALGQKPQFRPSVKSTAANGTAVNSTKIDAAAMNGTKTNGVVMNGTKSNGVVMNGTKSNGVVMNGTKSNGVVMNGTKSNGVAMNGTLANGNAVNVNGSAANGYAIAEQALTGVKNKDA